jgi:hypothetical protein
MKNNIFFAISLFFYSVTFSQNNNQTFIKVNNYSFFDNKLKGLMSSNLATFESRLKNNNTNGVYYDNYTGKYFEINNNYVYLKKDYGNDLIINVTNSTPKYYESKLVPQLLNDTLLLAFEGKIMNINTGQFLSIRVDQNNIYIEIKNPEQIECDGSILKSDILMQDFSDCSPRHFIYNLLSEGLFIHKESNAFRGKILNNPQSKYLMFTEDYIGENSDPGVLYWRFCLMNRFNANDTVDIPRFSVDGFNIGQRPPVIYSDSMIYYSVPINSSYKFLNYNFNENIDVELSENNFGSNNDDDFFQKLRRGSYGTEEADNAVATCYFHKKYNKLDVSNKNFEGFTSFYNTYKNLLGYSPYLIIEYNFRDKKIKSILDKPILPLSGISAMYLDKNSQFLIAQQPNNQFTIFNLKTKKEIFTLSGIISGINNKNELLINVLAPRQTSYSSAIPANIELTKLNLNELNKWSDEYFVSDFDSSLNVDEFTTKADFIKKINFKLNKINLTNPKIETTANKTDNADNIYDLYSNEYVNSFLEKKINDYRDVLNSGANKNDLVYRLNYLSYSMDNKLIEFMTNELEEDAQDFLSNFDTKEFEISDQRYVGKKYSIIRFKNVSIEDAKKLKDDSCFIIVKNTKPKNFNIPNIANLFVFRHFNTIKRNFYYNNEPETKQSMKFYNSYVPINTEKANYYNSWYLRFNNRDILLYLKK